LHGDRLRFEVIVKNVEVDEMSFDVRCFLVPHATGIVLIDTGVPGTVASIAAGLDRIGARWGDVTDIILTHKHFDHTASLREVAALAGNPNVWAGDRDRAEIPFEGSIGTIEDGDEVRDLRTLATPGHTAGHRSLLLDDSGLLFAGDVAGNMAGALTRGPEQFTEDSDQAERTLRHLAEVPWERMILSHGDEVADPRGELKRLLGEADGTPA
jgi:glyoxylase-like metal-dependent hydrolase (beta-lactamase superfamily II)